MSSITWYEPQPGLTRGCTIDAVVTEGDDKTLVRAFEMAWGRVSDAVRKLRDPEIPTTITVEVWQDTGRIIFVTKQKRDVARIIVTCHDIEAQYFSFDRNGASFEIAYGRQDQRLRDLLQAAFKSLPDGFIRQEMERELIEVVILDIDDESTNQHVEL